LRVDYKLSSTCTGVNQRYATATVLPIRQFPGRTTTHRSLPTAISSAQRLCNRRPGGRERIHSQRVVHTHRGMCVVYAITHDRTCGLGEPAAVTVSSCNEHWRDDTVCSRSTQHWSVVLEASMGVHVYRWHQRVSLVRAVLRMNSCPFCIFMLHFTL
jgi:hypothetical protein